MYTNKVPEHQIYVQYEKKSTFKKENVCDFPNAS